MEIVSIHGRSYEVHQVRPYFHAAADIGGRRDVKGEHLIVRQVRSKKFWSVYRYECGSYSRLIA